MRIGRACGAVRYRVATLDEPGSAKSAHRSWFDIGVAWFDTGDDLPRYGKFRPHTIGLG